MAIGGSGQSALGEAILRMVAFFDLFDFPLTAFELKMGLGRKLRDIRQELAASGLEERDGYYSLPGRSDIVAIRRARHNYGVRKIRIAKRFAAAFRLLPWVRTVALANSIGYNNLRDDSDIDFFIITAPGRIWLSRLYCTGLAKLLGRRPTVRTKRDRICLSFYLAADRLHIGDLKLPGRDPYFAEWRRQLVPLYNRGNTFEAFLAANDQTPGTETAPASRGRWWERLARAGQLRIMPRELKEAAGNSDGVVIGDGVLKFYQRDRRREFAQRYDQKIQALLGKIG